ncbi:MAG: DUF1566 domain-containing protein, partial [Spirochaetaceae bacterium]|nr:DUF1566 domain-containing protein [Spirochaetaceae bacterium]
GTYAWASSAYSYIEISGTAPDIGSGTVNTTTILTIDANAPAAKACADYAYGGYEDWFLPSKNELNLMWTNLKEQGRGDFIDNEYWSSSDGAYVYRPWNQNFSNGNPDYNIKYVTLLVRAARSF